MSVEENQQVSTEVIESVIDSDIGKKKNKKREEKGVGALQVNEYSTKI